ncbi:hypothetical protein GCM10010252_63520 [Streptomyces aureoverticillatus]|nr:hypothetical protein GCM10010252_63520 [Streptomyces aureoverticillatus]
MGAGAGQGYGSYGVWGVGPWALVEARNIAPPAFEERGFGGGAPVAEARRHGRRP